MENNIHPLGQQAQQQAMQAGQMELRDDDTPSSPALALVGLGRAVSYLEMHPAALTEALAANDWALRTAAVQALGKQGEHIKLEPLLHALRDEHPAVRAMAARALGQQGQPVPLAPLIAALHDPAWHVRTAAVLALGKNANNMPVEPLVSMLHDEQSAVRAAVIWALGNMGEKANIELLVTALQDTAWTVREAAVMALGAQGKRAPIAPLLAMRWDEDRSVRGAVEAVLAERLDEQPGQKLVAENAGQYRSSWLRLAVAVFSIVLLIPLAGELFGGSSYISHFYTISKLVALAVVCAAILALNIIYQQRRLPSTTGSQRKQSTSSQWHGFTLLAISVSVLVSIASLLLNGGVLDRPDLTADIVQFILICQLIALGCVSFTIVALNKVFHLKRK